MTAVLVVAAVNVDGATFAAIVAAGVAALASLVRWRSGERGNVLAQTAADLSNAAGQTVVNLMADNERLRRENAELESKLTDWERRVDRLTAELDALRGELRKARAERQ